MAVTYLVAYAGAQTMPGCLELLEPEMEERGHPLSLVLGDDTSVDTPWGLAKAYFDETLAFMDKNDGWNADGSMNREYNRIPFSDYAVTDSAGNSWTPYRPINSPYRVSLLAIHLSLKCSTILKFRGDVYMVGHAVKLCTIALDSVQRAIDSPLL